MTLSRTESVLSLSGQLDGELSDGSMNVSHASASVQPIRYEAEEEGFLVYYADDVGRVPLPGWSFRAVSEVVQALNSGDWSALQGAEGSAPCEPASTSSTNVGAATAVWTYSLISWGFCALVVGIISLWRLDTLRPDSILGSGRDGGSIGTNIRDLHAQGSRTVAEASAVETVGQTEWWLVALCAALLVWIIILGGRIVSNGPQRQT